MAGGNTPRLTGLIVILGVVLGGLPSPGMASSEGNRVFSTSGVVLNEVSFSDPSTWQWIEMVNEGSDPVNLAYWMLSDEDGWNYTIPAIPDIPPGGFVVVHIGNGTDDSAFGETQANALHLYAPSYDGAWGRWEVDPDFVGAWEVQVADFDLDGDSDISATSWNEHAVRWYEAPDDPRGRWIPHVVDDNLPMARSMAVEDIDRDGDGDILAGGDGYRLYWYENPSNISMTWTRHPVNTTYSGGTGGTLAVDLWDLDDDGDLDAVASFLEAFPAGHMAWYEAPTDPRQPWVEHRMDSTLRMPIDLEVWDVDNDMNPDIVLSDGQWGDRIYWYEAPDNPLNAWTRHSVLGSGWYEYPFDILGFDIDGDGDQDILTSGDYIQVSWFEAPSDPRTPWTQHDIYNGSEAARSINVGDVDGDGVDEIVVAGGASDDIVILNRPANPRDPWAPTLLARMDAPAKGVLADLDSDGDLDAVYPGDQSNQILWFENGPTPALLDPVDQVSLYSNQTKSNALLVDFVAWGGPPGPDDAIAAAAGQWTAGTFLSLAGFIANDTIGRDMDSTDTDAVEDWEISCGLHADYPTPGARNLNVDLEIGIAMDNGAWSGNRCYANLTGCLFTVRAYDSRGVDDVVRVTLALDTPGGTVVEWSRATDLFHEVSDPGDAIELTSIAGDSTPLDAFNWSLAFRMTFRWTFPADRMYIADATLEASAGGQSATPVPVPFIVENRLAFQGNLSVWSAVRGPVDDTTWIQDGERLNWTGVSVAFSGGEAFPLDSDFDVRLLDANGNAWSDNSSSGRNISITSVADGSNGWNVSHSLTVVSVPAGGVAPPPLEANLRIDGKGPSSAVVDPGVNWTNVEWTSLSATALDGESGVASITLLQDYRPLGGNWTAWIPFGVDDAPPYEWNATLLMGEGEYGFRSQATDGVGNVEPLFTEPQAIVGLDRTPPWSRGTTSAYWYRGNAVFPLEAGDAASGVAEVSALYRYALDNMTWSAWFPYATSAQPPWSIAFDWPAGPGHYQLRFNARDLAGNRENDGGPEFQTAYDNASPRISLERPTHYWSRAGSLGLRVDGEDSVSGLRDGILEYRHAPDNMTWSSWRQFQTPRDLPDSWDFDFPQGEGYYEIRARGWDVAGNEGVSPTVRAARDTGAPTATLTSPGPTWPASNPLRVTVIAFDNLSGVRRIEASLDGGPSIPVENGTVLMGEIDLGTHTLTVWIYDWAGNVAVLSQSIEVEDHGLPVVLWGIIAAILIASILGLLLLLWKRRKKRHREMSSDAGRSEAGGDAQSRSMPRSNGSLPHPRRLRLPKTSDGWWAGP